MLQFIKRYKFQIISTILFALFVALFFIPCITLHIPMNTYKEPYNIYLFIKNSLMPTNISITVIVFYVVSCCLSLAVVFLISKYKLAMLINFAPFIYFLTLIIYSKGNMGSFNAGFYITLLIGVFLLIYSIFYFVKMSKKPRKPRKPHNPTKAERIAELEKQVAELKNKSTSD